MTTVPYAPDELEVLARLLGPSATQRDTSAFVERHERLIAR